MPFKSLAQERFMFAKHPELANKWQKETPNQSNLPQHAPKNPYMKNSLMVKSSPWETMKGK